MPGIVEGYVKRPHLESEVKAAIINDRHPIVTLVGRGGIGKTSVVLAALREIANTERYSIIAWFSARDIDLMTWGAKAVQPKVVTDREIADQYRQLMGVREEDPTRRKNATIFMSEHLRNNPAGPTLFVFDNFETVRSPVDLFQWLDQNIRLPNKVVITTRFRDFKADFPIEVTGMEQTEAEMLISQTVASLGISNLIGRVERDALIEDSDGHPYVIKMILGDIANAGVFSKPSNLIARKDEVLDALFERTYAGLSPIAGRVFLTLSGWRSLVPQLAVEAAILRHGINNGNPESGIDQLIRMSLVERKIAGDQKDFLEVPLTAALFGKRKLESSPIRALVESDVRFLQDIGATASSGLKEGIKPRIETFFRKSARRISDGSQTLDALRPVLEFFARGYPPAWLILSDFEIEAGGSQGTRRAAECIRRYLESPQSSVDLGAAWQRLGAIYRELGDVMGGCSAFLKAAEASLPPLNEISAMANWLNNASQVKADLDVADRSLIFKPMAKLMEDQLGDASATDLSRLAWLHLHSGETDRALTIAELGLKREPDNIHCVRLVAKLTI